MTIERANPPAAVYDTTVFVGFFRGQQIPRDHVLRAVNGDVSAFVTAITEAELWAGIRDASEETRCLALLESFQRISIDGAIARQAGQYRRRFRHDGLSLPDALQAACAKLLGLRLVTANVRHFRLLEDEILFEFHPS